MSIATEITRLQNAKRNLKTAIQNKNVSVPNDATLDEYYQYVNSIQTGGGGGAAYCDNPLCFTAEQANSTVSLYIPSSLFGTFRLKYSYDKQTWHDWEIIDEYTTTINLSNVGNKVYIIGSNPQYGASLAYSQFILNGKVAASGNIMSLLTFDGGYTIAPDYAFRRLFYNCTALSSAPELPAQKVGSYAYEYMFAGCTNLINAPELPATIGQIYCYSSMFLNCTKLVNMPELPMMALASNCYQSMFQGCTSLQHTVQTLPAKTLASYCYKAMFSGCTMLQTAPELPATVLQSYCYNQMFYNCQALQIAPYLPATKLVSYCYNQMFWSCRSLNMVMVAFTSWLSNATASWLYNVQSSGFFICDETLPQTEGADYIPTNWGIHKLPEITLVDDYLSISTIYSTATIYYTLDGTIPNESSNVYTSPLYLKPEYGIEVKFFIQGSYITLPVFSVAVENHFYIEAINGPVSFSYRNSMSTAGTFSYSQDKISWLPYTNQSTLTLQTGERIYFKKTAYLGYIDSSNTMTYKFQCTQGTIKIGGCVSSLSHGEAMKNYYKLGDANGNYLSGGFAYKFYQCTALEDASDLILNIANGANSNAGAFSGCSLLQHAPRILDQAVESNCYNSMFVDCTSLITPPILPATKLKESCYANMFIRCSSLQKAPELPAKVLAPQCYASMFQYCTALNEIKIYAEEWGTNVSSSWVYGVTSSTGIFKKPSVTTIPVGTSGVPSGWTVENF